MGNRLSAHELGTALMTAANRWRRVLDMRLQPMGLSQATWRTLFILRGGGDGRLQKDLAQIMGVEGPSLVRILDALEREKLIKRRISRSDRRGKTVHLTDAGESLLRDIQSLAEGARIELLDGVSATDLRTAFDVFDRIKRNADALLEEAKDEQRDAAA